MEDKKCLDVGVKKSGVREHLSTVERFTGVPHWVSLRDISLEGQLITHLCLFLSGNQYKLTVTYGQSTTKLFVKKDGKWEEISES